MDIDKGAGTRATTHDVVCEKYHQDMFKQGKCYTCQQEGHKFYECPQRCPPSSACAATTGDSGSTAPSVAPSATSSSSVTTPAMGPSKGKGQNKAD